MDDGYMTDTTSDRYFGGTQEADLPVDRDELRAEIRSKYADVAHSPTSTFHFNTGRPNAERCRYDLDAVDRLPPSAVESFAGVANPFEPSPIEAGANVVDLGSGAGFDTFFAAEATGPTGHVIGIDMTMPMVEKARAAAAETGVDNVEFRVGFLEDTPVDDEWADVVISNGVLNLCPDKDEVMREINRILKPGGRLQFADIANGAHVPDEARRHIDLWTG